jgi:ABC-type arginine transport system permease subunit
VATIGTGEFELFVFACVALGLIWGCWAVAGLRGIYDSIGRGYLDVSTSDAVEPESSAEALADAAELRAAIAALREARREAEVGAEREMGEAA